MAIVAETYNNKKINKNLNILNSPASDALKMLVEHNKNSDVTLHIFKNCSNELKVIYFQDL